MFIRILDYKDFDKKKRKAFEETIGKNFKTQKISEALPDYLYTVFRAVTADVPNMNWDQFDTEELERFDDYLQTKVYQTFNGKSIFTNHQSSKVENSIGVIFDSEFDKSNPNDKFVEIIFGIDKKKAPDIARGIETKRLTSGSMGCEITHSICSVCGKVVYSESDFCNCLKHKKGEIINGVRVAERLRGVRFNEYSIVTVGADPKAKLRYIVSSVVDYKRLPKVADETDIFTILKIVANELKNASPDEKLSIIKKFDEVFPVVKRYNDEKLAVNDILNKKFGEFMKYVYKVYNLDLPGKVTRKGFNLNDLIGKQVEIAEDGSLILVS